MSSAGSLSSIGSAEFKPDEAFARQLDEADPLAAYRQRFHRSLTLAVVFDYSKQRAAKTEQNQDQHPNNKHLE